ncbi:hypothetical protein BURC_02299 [Burkholderiaceae bacterium]|nr:hypothetical protein BURC_02299 [Burkholderiaceae bacterium]
MRPDHVFISYRRDDAAGYARAVYDALAQRFGAERVFIDVDDIDAGQRFGEVIVQALAASRVLLVLIGHRWRGERPSGGSRLDDETDLVRREVATGLSQGLQVIPLLLDGAAMPSEAQLPVELRPLAGRNALVLHNARYADDMKRLLSALEEALGEAPSSTTTPRRKILRWGLGAAASAGIVGVALWWATRGPALGGVLGVWEAEVTYGWSDARHVERFVFRGDAGGLNGSASFLGVPRGMVDLRIDRDELSFVTRSQESLGDRMSELVHRYRGRRVGEELRLVMQTEGGVSAHTPVVFTARKVPAAR